MADGLIIKLGADVKGAVKGIEEVSLSLKEQRAVLANLQRQYAALSTEQLKSSFGKLMAADIRIATSEIKRLQAGAVSGLGQVGSAATKGFSALRQFAYVLPGIGVAGLIGGLTSLAMGFLSVGDAAKKAREENKKLAESISGDIVELTSLVAIVQNVNTTQGQREKALRAINQEYGKYLPNLKEEKVTLENISASYEKIIDSLLKQAVVKGLQEDIEKAVKKTAASIISLEREEQNRIQTQGIAEKKNKDQKESIVDLSKAVDFNNRVVRDGHLAGIRNEQVLQGQAKAAGTYESRLQVLKDTLKRDLLPLFGIMNNFSFEDLGIALNKVTPPKLDTFRPDVHVRVPISPEFLIDDKHIKFILAGGDRKSFKEAIQDKLSKEIQGLIIKPDFKTSSKGVLTPEQAAPFIELGRNASAAFEQGFQNSFASIGEGFGNLLKGEDFGSGLMDALSGLLRSLGQALIKFGIVKEGLDKIFGPGGLLIPGAVAIGLGALAIAAASALKNIPGRATGGAVQAGRPTFVGESGKEIFVPSASGRIIPNNSISGVSSASQMIRVYVEGRLSGREMILQQKREQRYQGRNV